MAKEIEFNDSYRNVNWNSLIQEANHSLVICVYYWDKWIKQHENALRNFLKKPNSTIQFFFSSSLNDVQRLFPHHTIDELTQKIKNTYEPLQNFLRDQQLPDSKVKVNYIPFALNYSLQCVDDQLLVMSFFEMARAIQIDAPGICIDLNKAPNTREFYQKELKGLQELSVNQVLSTVDNIIN